MTTTQDTEALSPTDTVREDVVRKLAFSKSVTLADVLKEIAPKGASVVSKPVPLPPAISQAQEEALATLVQVFGSVVPETVRALSETEVGDLLLERRVLTEIETLAKDRKSDIRTTVLNHLDTVYADDPSIPRDKEGHVLIKDTVETPDDSECFSWEIRNSGGDLDEARLKALEEQGVISHDDYLAMTEQVRVVNPNRVLEVLKAKPSLLDALAQATTPVTKTGGLYVRAKK